MPKNLIIVTNDDGVRSPGLLSVVQVLKGFGEIMVAAPSQQQSSQGRSFWWRERRVYKRQLRVGRQLVSAYSVNASPAVVVRHALMLLAKRRPALVVSGINYGENLGSGMTISGTVGAALEAAADGVPALAVSLETATMYHMTHSKEIDFSVAAHFAREFATRLVQNQLPERVPVLNVNVPSGATTDTPWRLTRASHQAYFRSLVNNGRFVGYDVRVDRESLEADSDIYAVLVDRVVSVTPLTYDLTARVDFDALDRALRNGSSAK